MVTIQEYLDKKYSTKEERARVETIYLHAIKNELQKQNIELEPVEEIDLSDYAGLTILDLKSNELTNIDLTRNTALTTLNLGNNQLTSIDFLNTLPNPEKLMELVICDNNIQPTDISCFNKFTNLEYLKTGTMRFSLKRKGKHNKFYGSFESLKDLSKLRDICIEATDIDRGLEYLPLSLVKATGRAEEYGVKCSSYNTNAKCVAIENELRPFNYDLEAWQLAHPEKMLIARPELFTNPNSREQWINALGDKITSSQQELQENKLTLKKN